jgi:predicted O-methyltransferase YrrM
MTSPQAECCIEQYLPALAAHWSTSEASLQAHLRELNEDKQFLSEINAAIEGVPEFAGAQFDRVAQMRVYRILLYLVTRAFRPQAFVETGVHNGMSSAFILLGMEHNGSGRLFSVDLPPVEQRILDQGTNALPKQKSPGWLIPDFLRHRHDLRLGRAEALLPVLLDEIGSIDVFLHDSDHCYSHIMFELGIAWPRVAPGGWLLVDNIEQNAAFDDFARGVGARSFVVSTFDGSERVWRHGLFAKPKP